MPPLFIQFPHPGSEGGCDRARWAHGHEPHVRKFLRAEGHFRRTLEGSDVADEIGFWAEWEAESECESIPRGGEAGHPGFLHRPVVPDAARRPRPPQNTDPFVFGERFLYTFCKQDSVKRLKRLERGSVLVFGSKLAGSFVCDTVFVVADAVEHTKRSCGEVLAGLVSPAFVDATLEPMYVWTHDRDRPYTLYVGATPSDPVDGMFSFVPCAPLGQKPRGFPRPRLDGVPGINPANARQIRLNRDLPPHDISAGWRAVAKRVLAADCSLGTHIELEAGN